MQRAARFLGVIMAIVMVLSLGGTFFSYNDSLTSAYAVDTEKAAEENKAGVSSGNKSGAGGGAAEEKPAYEEKADDADAADDSRAQTEPSKEDPDSKNNVNTGSEQAAEDTENDAEAKLSTREIKAKPVKIARRRTDGNGNKRFTPEYRYIQTYWRSLKGHTGKLHKNSKTARNTKAPFELTVSGRLPEDVTAEASYLQFDEGSIYTENALFAADLTLLDGNGGVYVPEEPVTVTVSSPGLRSAVKDNEALLVYSYRENADREEELDGQYAADVLVYKDGKADDDRLSYEVYNENKKYKNGDDAVRYSEDRDGLAWDKGESAASFEYAFDETGDKAHFVFASQTAERRIKAASGLNVITLEGAIRKDVELRVSEITEKSKTYDTYVEKAADAVDAAADDISFARAFDIKLIDPDTGREFEPDSDVRVSIGLKDEKLNDKETNVDVVHFEGSGTKKTEVMDSSVSGRTVEFSTDGFSVYVVVGYTVDFHWGEYTYSIEGESSILLSDLLTELGVPGAALMDIEDVEFSDPSLMKVEKKENEQADPETDWLLTSLAPFKSDEELTLTLKDGKTVSIIVTDAIVPPENAVCRITDSNNNVLSLNAAGTTLAYFDALTNGDADGNAQTAIYYVSHNNALYRNGAVYKGIAKIQVLKDCTTKMVRITRIYTEDLIIESGPGTTAKVTWDGSGDHMFYLYESSAVNLKVTFKDIVVDGGSIPKTHGAVFRVTSGAELTLDSGAVVQNGYATNGNANSHGGGVDIYGSGSNTSCTMNEGAVIRNCRAGAEGGGGINLHSGGRFIMNGGTIEDCKTVYGSTVYSNQYAGGAIRIENGGIFEFRNGTIKNCTSVKSGGAIWFQGNGSFVMTGGSIENCTAENDGGAVYMPGGSFSMESGSIKNCTASGGNGGALNLGGGTFTMSGGLVDNCTATAGKGGAFYISGSGATLNISGNAEIKKSTSTDGAVYVNRTGNTNAKINFSGSPKIIDNSNNNVNLTSFNNRYTDEIVNATGVLSDAQIGLYIGDSGHDSGGEDFGTTVKAASTSGLAGFINDRNTPFVGWPVNYGQAGNVYWANPIRMNCKVIKAGVISDISGGEGLFAPKQHQYNQYTEITADYAFYGIQKDYAIVNNAVGSIDTDGKHTYLRAQIGDTVVKAFRYNETTGNWTYTTDRSSWSNLPTDATVTLYYYENPASVKIKWVERDENGVLTPLDSEYPDGSYNVNNDQWYMSLGMFQSYFDDPSKTKAPVVIGKCFYWYMGLGTENVTNESQLMYSELSEFYLKNSPNGLRYNTSDQGEGTVRPGLDTIYVIYSKEQPAGSTELDVTNNTDFTLNLWGVKIDQGQGYMYNERAVYYKDDEGNLDVLNNVSIDAGAPALRIVFLGAAGKPFSLQGGFDGMTYGTKVKTFISNPVQNFLLENIYNFGTNDRVAGTLLDRNETVSVVFGDADKRVPVIVRKEWKNIAGHENMKQDVPFTIIGKRGLVSVDLTAYDSKDGYDTVKKLTSADATADDPNAWEKQVWVNEQSGSTHFTDGDTHYYTIKEGNLNGSWDAPVITVGTRDVEESSSETVTYDDTIYPQNSDPEFYVKFTNRTGATIRDVKYITFEFEFYDSNRRKKRIAGYSLITDSPITIVNANPSGGPGKGRVVINGFRLPSYVAIMPDGKPRKILYLDLRDSNGDLIRRFQPSDYAAQADNIGIYTAAGSSEATNTNYHHLTAVGSNGNPPALMSRTWTEIIETTVTVKRPLLTIKNTYLNGNRKVILRKVDGSSNYYSKSGANFFVYRCTKQENDWLTDYARDSEGRFLNPEQGNTHSPLTSGSNGVYWIGKLPYGEYIVEETGPSRFYCMVVDENGSRLSTAGVMRQDSGYANREAALEALDGM